MAFRLAEAYTELSVRTNGHDRAIDRSTDKVKLYGVESQKVQSIGVKMFFAIGAGAESAEAIIGKVGGALRSLGGKLLEAARSGTQFGDAIARWATETLGLETAVSKLDRRLKEQNQDVQRGLVDRLLGLGGSRPIPGLDPANEKRLQAERDSLEAKLPGLVGAMLATQARADEARGFAAGNNSGVLAHNLEVAENEARAAALALKELQLNIEEVNGRIKDEVFLKESAVKAEGDRKKQLEQLGVVVGNLTDKLFRVEREGLAALGNGIRDVVGRAGRGAGVDAAAAAELDREIQQALDNGRPEDRGRLPRMDRSGDSQRAAFLGMEEFSRNILSATAGQTPEVKALEEQKKVLEAIDKKMQIQNDLQRRAPPAVFADGAQV